MHSPTVKNLIQILGPLGYTIKIEKIKKWVILIFLYSYYWTKIKEVSNKTSFFYIILILSNILFLPNNFINS
jgi:hypothetical protein